MLTNPPVHTLWALRWHSGEGPSDCEETSIFTKVRLELYRPARPQPAVGEQQQETPTPCRHHRRGCNWIYIISTWFSPWNLNITSRHAEEDVMLKHLIFSASAPPASRLARNHLIRSVMNDDGALLKLSNISICNNILLESKNSKNHAS